MFSYLIDLSLRYRRLVLGLGVLIAGIGMLAWTNLTIDAFPDISPTQVKIILKIPGMTPEEVEQRVVRPIEIEMLSIPKKRIVRSVSKYGIADLTIDFEDGTDIYWARQQVAERLSGFMKDMPSGTTGGLAPITTPLSELYMFTVEGEGYSLAQKRKVLDWMIRPELRIIPGVAEVNALGGEVASYEINPDHRRMAARGVTLADLRAALQANNTNDGAGRLTAGEESLVIRVEGAVKTLDDVRQIRVPKVRGGIVALDDIATVRLGSATRYGAVTKDGQGETVQGLVLGIKGVNARNLVKTVDAKLQELTPRLPSGMTIKTFYNRGDLVSRSAGTVIKALAEAIVLVCIVLYFFLGNLRAAVAVAICLPLSMLITFSVMKLLGISANLMSLGGLAIAIGMLVDASVVVVENIEAAFAERLHEHRHGLSTVEMLVGATKQVVKPVVSGMLIIAVVFLPLLTLEGLEGKLFSPVATTIVIALASSLVVAFSVVPAFGSIVLSRHVADEPLLMAWVRTIYLKLRKIAWSNTKKLYVASLLGFLAAVVMYLFIGKTFMPTLDEGDILVQLQKTPSISLETSLGIDTRVQQSILQSVPEVSSIVARTGSDDLGLDPMGLNETDSFLVLKPKSEWSGDKEQIVDKLRAVLTQFPDLVYAFTQPIEMRVSEMLTGARGDVAIKVFGADLNEINHASQVISAAIKSIHGASEVIAPRPEGMQYMSVKINKPVAGQAGFTTEILQQNLRNLVEGEMLGLVLDGVVRTPLIVKGSDRLSNNVEGFKNLMITAPDGKVWPLSALAEIKQIDGPIRIDHEQSSRFASIQVSVQGRALTAFVEDAKLAVQKLNLPKNLNIVWGGQFENQQRASARLALVIPIALITIFFILTATFGSTVQAIIIFLNIPFALVGGVMSLAISGQYLSVPASVGFIALLGIAVLNGVVMVSHFNERIMMGEDIQSAVMNGSERRLRPVLMTTVITALGMIPLLLATGPGSEIQRPLAIVVIGGLITSTLLTLLLLPKIYERFGAYESLGQIFSKFSFKRD